MARCFDTSTLKRFLAGECNYSEAEKIVAYFKEHTEELDELDIFDEEGSEINEVLNRALKEKVYKQITGHYNTRFISLKKVLIAACILAAILGLFFIYTHSHEASLQEDTVGISDKTIVNSSTESLRVTLPDGSKMVLSPAAALSYKDNFEVERNVEVTRGQVFFEIAKNERISFNVVANGIKTTAIGTQFTIENDEVLHSVKVKLKEGLVSVISVDDRFKMDSVYLKPSQECLINTKTGRVEVVKQEQKKSKTIANPKKEEVKGFDNTVLWTNKELQLSKANLGSVLHKLENRYNITILADEESLQQTTITGRILYSDSLDVIIKSICDINHLRFEKKKDTIILMK